MNNRHIHLLLVATALSAAACGTETPSATSDVPVATADTGVDAGTTVDVPVTIDVPTALDVPTATDTPTGTDVPAATDTPAVTDTPTATDHPVVSDAGTGCFIVPRTCADVLATFPSGNSNLTVTCDATAGSFTITSTGVPNYTSNQHTPNSIASQGWVAVLPLNPGCAATPTSVVASRGEVGFMINGVPFYGPQDAMGRDAVIFEGSSFDDCEGHADQFCSYHYHEEPRCVFGVGDTAAHHMLADGHPPVIGYALDGIAIYASYTTATALDGCNGHSDATRGYHYHATATSPYLIGCYTGHATGRVTRAMALCTSVTSDGGAPRPDAGTPPPADAGTPPPADAGTAMPRACTTSAQCTGACPAGSTGCTCAMTMMGMGCVPSCNSNTDCPTVAPHCDTTAHVCRPM